MPKWFNTAGPCRPDKHYMVPAIARLPPLDRLIALAKEIVEELVSDEQTTITPEHMHHANEILIQRRETHLDSLADRLEESCIRAVMEPLMAGL